DGNNSAVSGSCTDPTESVSVAKATATVATQASASGPATDTATVSGSGPTPTGTVAFFLCQPATVIANGGSCASGGAQVGAAKQLSGGQAISDASTDTTAPGTYCWRAEYSGDGSYDPASHTNATSECFTVAAAAGRADVSIKKAHEPG